MGPPPSRWEGAFSLSQVAGHQRLLGIQLLQWGYALEGIEMQMEGSICRAKEVQGDREAYDLERLVSATMWR